MGPGEHHGHGRQPGGERGPGKPAGGERGHGKPAKPGKHGKHERHDGGRRGEDPRHAGAQTFRRGRALEFLQRLEVQRATLAGQLARPELQAIHQVIGGELKAVELLRNEFIQLFELHEGVPPVGAEEEEDEEEATGASAAEAARGAPLEPQGGAAAEEAPGESAPETPGGA